MRKWKVITKADVILAVVMIAVGIAAGVCFAAGSERTRGSAAEQVVISVDGKVYGTYLLSQNQRIPVQSAEGRNEVVIDNGSVYMASASCRNQICVETGRISAPGRSIVCLPNRVVVEIRGGSTGEGYDAISR